MSHTPTLDELEREVTRTLRAKADQLAVPDRPFSPDEPVAGTVVALAPRRRPTRLLAAAAAVVVLAGALGALAAGRRGEGPSYATAPVAAARYGTPSSGVVGFALAGPPAGWTLQRVDAPARRFEAHGARWQLFGDASASPMARAVLVGTVRDVEGAAIDGASHAVHGEPASVVPSPDPLAPAGALQARWLEGDLVHEATAVGMTAPELVAFLDGLAPHDDPAQGFAAPPGSALAEAAAVAVDDAVATTFTYRPPGGAGREVRVVATSGDRTGGLLHRLAGEREGDGYVIRGRLGGDGLPLASVARDDGWTVDVSAAGTDSDGEATGLLDAALAALAPVTAVDVLDAAIAAPVTATHRVDGWRIEVRSTADEDVALCLARAGGEPTCATAEAVPGAGLTSASLAVDGDWVVVTVADGTRTVTLRSAPASLAAGWPPDFEPEDLTGATTSSGTAEVGVHAIPARVDAVDVVVWSGSQGVGASYARPAG